MADLELLVGDEASGGEDLMVEIRCVAIAGAMRAQGLVRRLSIGDRSYTMVGPVAIASSR